METFTTNADRTESRIDDPLIIEQPSPEMTREDFVSEQVMSLLFAGNSYSLVTARDDFGFPLGLFNVPTSYVQVSRENVFGRIRYHVGAIGEVNPADILHIAGIRFPGELVGISPLQAVRQVFNAALTTQKHAEDSFKSQVPSVAITTTDNPDQDDVDAMSKQWAAVHSGPGRVPAFLPAGTVVTPLSISSEDQELLESRKFSVLEIARIYQVPAFLLQEATGQTSWGAGLEIQGTAFVRYSLAQWLSRIEKGFSSLLPRGQFVRFNTEELLRGSTLERYQAAQIGITSGFLLANEVRKDERREPLDEDLIRVPKDISSISEPANV